MPLPNLDRPNCGSVSLSVAGADHIVKADSSAICRSVRPAVPSAHGAAEPVADAGPEPGAHVDRPAFDFARSIACPDGGVHRGAVLRPEPGLMYLVRSGKIYERSDAGGSPGRVPKLPRRHVLDDAVFVLHGVPRRVLQRCGGVPVLHRVPHRAHCHGNINVKLSKMPRWEGEWRPVCNRRDAA